MKRSSVLAVTAIIIITFIFVVSSILPSGSKNEKIKTVLTGKEWLNLEFGSDRLELKGKTTLVVFWNCSSVASRKTIKKINEWKEKYGAALQFAGVHSPEFAFEKNAGIVGKVTEELKLKWPVVLDNTGVLKQSFNAKTVPSFYIIDKGGRKVFFHSGDGEYELLENALREALKKANPSAVLPEAPKSSFAGICFVSTPDFYCGSAAGKIANREGLGAEKFRNYKGIKEIPENSLALNGKFKPTREYLESGAQGAGLLLNFTATEVNIIAEAGKSEAVLEVLLDGAPVPEASKGKNLDEKNQVKIKGAGMYQLIKNKKKPAKGVLSVRNVKGDYRVYAFRFYGCSE